MYGRLGAPLARLPKPLDKLVGRTVDQATAVALRSYLARHQITEADIGGPISNTLPLVRYFVIHDTSTYLKGRNSFPQNINDEAWSGNNLKQMVTQKVTHVWVNRTGNSATTFDFGALNPPNGTKFGRDHADLRPYFVHVENVQPRICDPKVRECCPVNSKTGKESCNDAIAPAPGFTGAQYDRLALLYVAGSVRHGQWLVPAFHAAVDAGYPDAHDDPQDFDLAGWTSRLEQLLKAIRRGE
jgi:hypothetical protein